ncbi:MAG: AAA family ATPase, partial [Planctomycetaceae bacterium]|nr:AAA family ATPase [Planctomycetaceae bacterium]
KAETVAKLLQDEKLQRDIRGQVIWIDEAGLLGTRTLHDVFQLAEKADARIVLSGDSRQHGSVERGDSLRLLEEHAGIVPAEVTEIRRQQGAYKDAVAALSRGQAAEGFARLDQLGFVSELPDDQRYQKLAADYVDAVTRNKSVLVVAPTHAEGEQVTTVIRDRLKVDGRLDVEELSCGRLKNRNWTEAERTDVARYHTGDVVQFTQNAKGIRRGERLAVDVVEEGVVWLNRGDGRVPLPVTAPKSYQVYAVDEIGLAQGDHVRITQNGTTRDGKHRLNNGAHYEVAGFTPRGDVKLANGWTVDRDFGHWAYGYATTSHASQGRTVDQVFVAQSSASLPASSLEQFYVSCSRAKEKVAIYTDDKLALQAAIQDSTQRLSATELLAETLPAAMPTWRERAWQQFERVRQYGYQLQTTAHETWQRWRESNADRTPPTPKRELTYE